MSIPPPEVSLQWEKEIKHNSPQNDEMVKCIDIDKLKNSLFEFEMPEVKNDNRVSKAYSVGYCDCYVAVIDLIEDLADLPDCGSDNRGV